MTPVTPPTTDTEPLSDAEKLRVLATWFDLYDRDPFNAKRLLRESSDESASPPNEVQRDLRRIAVALDAERTSGGLLDEIERVVNLNEPNSRMWIAGAHYVLRSIRRGSATPQPGEPDRMTQRQGHWTPTDDLCDHGMSAHGPDGCIHCDCIVPGFRATPQPGEDR